MGQSNSLDEYIHLTTKRYSSLFMLPSHRSIIIFLSLLCVFGDALSVLLLNPTYNGFAIGLTFGAATLLLILLSDFIASALLLNSDAVYNLKRCNALSLFSSVTWFALTFFGNILSFLFKNPSVWFKLFLLGFCAATILRLVVLWTTSSSSFWRIFTSSVTSPLLCLFSISLVRPAVEYEPNHSFLFFLPLSILVSLISVGFFVFLVNSVGKKTMKFGTLSIFKALMANWMANLNGPLESFFEKLGREEDVKISMLAFHTKNRIKAFIVVPSIHPGPFRNVGSSLLPYMIQTALEAKLQCKVSVPHGLFGHELDLSSQIQNQRIIENILNSAEFQAFDSEASPFIHVQKGVATAGCQIFGNCALFTLTLAPKTTEDLPEELGSIIFDEVKKSGLSSAIIINAHNSIDGQLDKDSAVNSLKDAALASFKKALESRRALPQVGAARVTPKEFTVKDGLGPGGISVTVVNVGKQKAAYVTIDGNNMVSRLREKILQALHKVGINDGEVLTTDTHAVNGVVSTARGYYPVGEVVDHEKLIGYIRQAVIDALKNVEPAESAWQVNTIPAVKVIGEEQVKSLSVLVDATVRRAKRALFSIFPLTGAFLIALLLILF